MPVAVRHHLAHQGRVLGLDLVVAEVDDVGHPEHALVELDPAVHLTELDVADDVVDRDQAGAAAAMPVRRQRDVAGEVRPVVLGPVDEGVDALAVGRDRRELDPPVLVLDPLRVCDAARSALQRLTVGVSRVRNLQGDVLRRIAVLGRETADVAVGTNAAREHEANVALLQHIRRAIANARLGAGVRDPLEAERVLVPVGRLLGVADPKLEVIPPLEWHEIALYHGRDVTAARKRAGAPVPARPQRYCSGGEEPIEERPVPLQRHAEILGGGVLT